MRPKLITTGDGTPFPQRSVKEDSTTSARARLTMLITTVLVLCLLGASLGRSPITGAEASPTLDHLPSLNKDEYAHGQARQLRLSHNNPPSFSSAPSSSSSSSSSSTTEDQDQDRVEDEDGDGDDTRISAALFAELEEFARVVDIAYCVGVTGIRRPFACASRCADFPTWELVDTWNTGPLLSDSCGYVALDHGQRRIVVVFRGTYSLASTMVDLATVPQRYVPYPSEPARDGGDEGGEGEMLRWKEGKAGGHGRSGDGEGRWMARESKRVQGFYCFGAIQKILAWFDSFFDQGSSEAAIVATKEMGRGGNKNNSRAPRCHNCTVHSGFLASWLNTRSYIIPHIEDITSSPLTSSYTIHLVGHSLGGAVAALGALELSARGWRPIVTTFGEPRIGNDGLRRYVDEVFQLRQEPRKQPRRPQAENEGDDGGKSDGEGHTYEPSRFRRVTHVDDPIPLLPLTEWNYLAHAGEIYIEKAPLSPLRGDLRHCRGDADPSCIQGGEKSQRATLAKVTAEMAFGAGRVAIPALSVADQAEEGDEGDELDELEEMDDVGEYEEADGTSESGEMYDVDQRWAIPARYKMWQLFFAHRDYFWRIGLCVPGGDPWNWESEGDMSEEPFS